MSIRTTKKQIVDLVLKAYPMVPLKSTLQILSNIKLSFDGTMLSVTSTDLDHSIEIKQPVEGEAPFEAAVNGKKLAEIVKELPDTDVVLNVDENILTIETTSGFSCKIAGADTQDFPGFPVIEDGYEIEISPAQLAEMINKTCFAVSKDESRACLCGVYWQIEPTRCGMVATDGHRLGSSFIDGSFNVQQKVSAVVVTKSLTHLVRTLGDTTSPLQVQIGERYVVFNTGEMRLCSKQVEGPYPDYEKFIPQNNSKQVLADRMALLDAARRVSVLSNQKTNLVEFAFQNNEAELTVLNRDIGGEAREVLPVEYSGEEHAIGFNALYLSEILGIVKTPTVRMEMNTQISACLIFPVYEDDSQKSSDDLFLIMPLRIME